MHSIHAKRFDEVFVSHRIDDIYAMCYVMGMQTVNDILELWPSMADLGRDLDLPYSTVAAWKQRGSIPPQHWLGLIRASRSRGNAVTSDMLTEAHGRDEDVPAVSGMAEESRPDWVQELTPMAGVASEGVGHFSRWKPLRRSHFSSMDEINDHVRALREEWDRR